MKFATSDKSKRSHKQLQRKYSGADRPAHSFVALLLIYDDNRISQPVLALNQIFAPRSDCKDPFIGLPPVNLF